MRAVRFRGRTPIEADFCGGEWVEGFYTCFNGKEHRIYSGYAETDCGDYYPDWYNVTPETVGQFTGLYDKNGKRIFEGDILNERPPMNKEGVRGFVAWDEDRALWRLVFKDNPEYLAVLGTYSNSYTVIGNVHNNPELLQE